MKIFALEKSVGSVVFLRKQDDFKYLLLQYRSGQWDFPKGHQELGETEQETLLREIREETGISDLKIISNFRNSTWYFYSAWGNEKKERLAQKRGIRILKKVVHYITETETENVMIDFENLDYKWLNFDEALRVLGNKDSKKLIVKVQKYLQRRKEY